LLQGPSTDPNTGETTAVNVYYKDATGAQNLTAMNIFNNSVVNPIGGVTTNGTTPQFSITKDTAGVEYIAIQADCHYLLLDTITSNNALIPTPEPGSFGFALAALLGIGMVVRKRRAAQQQA